MARIGSSGPARPAWLKAAAACFCCRGRGILWRPLAQFLFSFMSPKSYSHDDDDDDDDDHAH